MGPASLLILLVIAASTIQPLSRPCTLQVQRERDPKYGERPFAETVPYAPIKGHRNEAPGPDSLLLVSRTTRGFYPRVYLENRGDGTSRCLEPKGWSEIPSWAPNGRWFAYVHKDTVANVQQLVVGSPRRPRAAVFDRSVDIVDYWWSPDSRAIALYGRDRATRAEALYVFWPGTRASWRVDQLSVFLDYDVAWSPSSRFVTFSRPEEANEDEEIVRADLFLADAQTRYVCRLLCTPDRVEREPQWISTSALRCTVMTVRGQVAGTPREIVLELKANGSSSR